LPSSSCERKVMIPIEEIWNFISDMNNWAPLVPGYKTHTMINNEQSIWVCKGDIGAIQKTVQLTIFITEWRQPEKVAFTLSNTSKQLVGQGYFQAEKLCNKQTKIIGSLTITVKGLSGKIINSALRAILPKIIANFTDTVIKQIQEKKPAVMQ
jgi:carbon monoxide dehydrogenase subunit G